MLAEWREGKEGHLVEGKKGEVARRGGKKITKFIFFDGVKGIFTYFKGGTEMIFIVGGKSYSSTGCISRISFTCNY